METGQMPGVYVRLSGRDIDNRLLELHGLKTKRIVVDVSWRKDHVAISMPSLGLLA